MPVNMQGTDWKVYTKSNRGHFQGRREFLWGGGGGMWLGKAFMLLWCNVTFYRGYNYFGNQGNSVLLSTTETQAGVLEDVT